MTKYGNTPYNDNVLKCGICSKQISGKIVIDALNAQSWLKCSTVNQSEQDLTEVRQRNETINNSQSTDTLLVSKAECASMSNIITQLNLKQNLLLEEIKAMQ